MKWLSLVLVLALAMSFVGCGSSNNTSTTKPSISVSLTPSSTVTIVQGQQKSISATLANDTASQGVSWTLSGTGCTGSACGTLTGVTTSAAIYNSPATVTSSMTVSVVATSIGDTTKSASVSVTVMPLPSITTTSLPSGVQNSAYTSTTMAGSGGIAPLTWSVSVGSLPAGLTLNSTTGVISGTPTAAGTSNFTIQVADASSPAFTATKALSIVIAPPPLTITTTSLPSGAINSSYSATLLSSGGTAPIAWSVTTGTLPTGLTLHSTGLIDGTPTAAGTTNFTVTATDAGTQTKTQTLAIVINPVLSITTASLPDGAMNTAYSATLVSSGGTVPVTWAVTSGSLPAGLTLNAANGVISGTPTSIGTANFSVSASDSSNPQQTMGAALSINVAAAPLAITSTTLPSGTIGTAYNTSLRSSGGTPPVTWSVTAGSLPGWASLDASTGAITGTPNGSPATTTFTVTATDTGTPVQTKSQALSIVTVSGGVNNAELNGHYAFVMRGFDSVGGGAVTTAGSFVADGNGNVTGGVVDVNTTTSNQINVAITGGFYSVGADQRGTLSITTAQGTSTYAFSLGSISSGVASLGHIIGTDHNVVSGVFKKQDTTAFTTASSTGSYVIGLAGIEQNGRFSAAGRVVLDGAGNVTSATVDANDAGTVSQQTFVGTYAVTDTVNGRGTFNDTTDGSHMAMYVVSASEIFIINVDVYSNNSAPVYTGSALKQSGSFSNASLNGISVASFEGFSGAGGYAALGLLTTNGTGGFTALIDENDAGTITAQGSITGTYSVDSTTGRVTLTVSSGHAPVLYLASAGKGFWLGTGGAVQNGSFEPQVGSSFTNGSITGSYAFGDDPPTVSGTTISSGIVVADGAGNLTGTSDENQGGAFSVSPFTQTYAVSSNGRVVFPQSVMYLISPSKAVMIQTTNETNPTVTVVDK
jgi:hypothetical protein